MICLNSQHVTRNILSKDMDLRMKGAIFHCFTSLIIQKLQPRELHLS